jgi:hypothetical protein
LAQHKQHRLNRSADGQADIPHLKPKNFGARTEQRSEK